MQAGHYRMPGILALLLFLKFAVFAQCGSERWDVKTLQDAEAGDISFTPVISTVHKQLQFTKPAYHEANPRDITEKKVYRIDCILIKYKQEGDKDWHLEVKDLDTNEKFVVEIPDPACVDMNNPHFNKLILARKRLVAKVGPVKTQFRVPSANTKLRVTGVGFFDKSNHPEGFKGRELHPVINLVVL